MKFYTSVLPYRGKLLVRGINQDGSRKKFRIPYKPSLFIPTGKESKFKTLDGRNVAKIKFDSIPEATKWVNEYKNVTNFELDMLKPLFFAKERFCFLIFL